MSTRDSQFRRKKILSRRRPPSFQGERDGVGGGRGSVPSTPDSSAAMELGTEVSDSDSGNVHSPVSETTPPLRMQGAKVRLSGSYSVPPTVIEELAGETEDNEEGLTPGGVVGEEEEGERLWRFQRSLSPSLQVPPSPVRGFSPNSSPRNTRKTRVAVRRTRSHKGEWISCSFKCALAVNKKVVFQVQIIIVLWL